MIQLTHPHSILQAIQSRPADVRSVDIPSRTSGTAWEEVEDAAEAHGILLRPSRGGDVGRATVKPRAEVAVEALFEGAGEVDGGRGVWLALDRIQDPHNVGALFRTAAFFGVRGVILTAERSSPVTATVYDVASGGVELVPHSRQSNLRHALDVAKDAGVWVLGTAEDGEVPLAEVPCERPWLAVVGNEMKGMRRLTAESCDMSCRLEPAGDLASLNVSVACGVVLSTLTAGRTR